MQWLTDMLALHEAAQKAVASGGRTICVSVVCENGDVLQTTYEGEKTRRAEQEALEEMEVEMRVAKDNN